MRRAMYVCMYVAECKTVTATQTCLLLKASLRARNSKGSD